MSIPLPAPAERFATIIQRLSQAVVMMLGGNRLPQPLVNLIIDRLRGIKQRFGALAARVAGGLYIPRPRATPPRKRPGQAAPKNPLPNKFRWLLPLVPEAVSFRAQLECLLRDPEMAALLAAAPGPMGRALRPLCRMLGLVPPDILARPRKPSPPRSTEPTPKPPRPARKWPPAGGPGWMQGLRRSIVLPKKARQPKTA